MLNINKKIIQHYLETLGLDSGAIYIKDGKIIKRQFKHNQPQQEVKPDTDKNNDIYSQAENTCDKIINNIDKLLKII